MLSVIFFFESKYESVIYITHLDTPQIKLLYQNNKFFTEIKPNLALAIHLSSTNNIFF